MHLTHRRQFIKGVSASALAGFLPFSSANAHPNVSTLKPQRLKTGDTIGLISPSHFATEKQLRSTIQNMAQLGFCVKYTPNMLVRKGYLGGTDKQRADDINQMFADDSVAGIMCVTGGYGTTRLLPYLDYELIKSHPKPLIGFSDITGLLYGIYSQTGLIGFHGPVGDSDYNDFTTKYFRQVLMEPQQTLTYEQPENLSQEELVPLYLKGKAVNISQNTRITLSGGVAEGPLVGGNLSLVTALCGTAYDVDMRDKIVFLEDVGEAPYRIDRMLTQLLLSPDKLPAAKGIALGLFTNCEAEDENSSFSLAQVLQDRLASLGIPVLYGLTFGHIRRNMTLPFGVQARLDASAKDLTLSEAAVV